MRCSTIRRHPSAAFTSPAIAWSHSATCNASGETAVNFTGLTPGANTLTDAGLTNGKAWSCTVTGLATYGNGSTSSASQTTSNSATPWVCTLM